MRWGLGAFARRPGLLPEAVRTLAAMSPARWWRAFPFVPRLDPRYVAWRRATAYGTEEAWWSSEDLVGYLEWRRRQRRIR